jgi:hypothetical protein
VQQGDGVDAAGKGDENALAGELGNDAAHGRGYVSGPRLP